MAQLAIVVLALITLCGCEARAAKPVKASSNTSPIGMNLMPVTDYSSEYPFVDAFKSSRAWISGTDKTWDDGRKLDVDSDGWIRSLQPGQLARTLMFWGEGRIDYPAGDWTITWEGAEPEVTPHEIVEKTKNKIVLRVNPKKGGIMIVLRAPAKNIRVIAPGGACSNNEAQLCTEDAQCGGGKCELFAGNPDKHPFHPTFLASIQPFSTIRFMDWMSTNNSDIRTPAQRPKLGNARWTTHGVPLEVIFDLANRTRSDAWINVPHLANDALVEEMARIAKEKLAKDRLLYVEHSNEVWNAIFTQAKFAQGEGSRLAADLYEGQLKWHAERTAHVSRIFSATFGTDRLVRVLGSQAANPWVSETVLAHKNTWRHVDVLAIAPYFGGDIQSEPSSLEDLLTEIETKAVPEAEGWIRAQKKIADKFGVQLVAYEGGPHLVAHGPLQNNQKLNFLFDEANRHPRMRAAYARFLESWKKTGGALYMHYASTSLPGKFGRWGAREQLTQDRKASPKLDALLSFIEKNPRWW